MRPISFGCRRGRRLVAALLLLAAGATPALAALRPQASVEVLNVTEKRGGYLAGAEVALPAKRPAQAPGRLVVAFPGEPWDGIWATEEERRQGR